MQISRCLLVLLLGGVILSEAFLKSVVRSGRDVAKGGVLGGATGASKGVGAVNSAVQFGAKTASAGANKTANAAGNLVLGATAISGLSLVTGATYAHKGIEFAGKHLEKLPIFGNVLKLTALAAKKGVSSVNHLGQSSLSAVDNVGTSSIGLANRVVQIGAIGTSGVSTIGTGVTQTGLALGATAANTGVDITANAAEKLVDRLTTSLTKNSTETVQGESFTKILTNNLVESLEKIVPQVSNTIESRL